MLFCFILLLHIPKFTPFCLIDLLALLDHREKLDTEEHTKVKDELGREDAPADSELETDTPLGGGTANMSAVARMAAPAELVAQLLPFQEEGLAWMYAQEEAESLIAGGILADEMGMGKTMQAIALILQRTADTRAWRDAGTRRGCTLVIAPVSAMTQWAHEISARTLPGSLSVLIWHGSDRHLASSEDLSGYDIVVTSYAVLEIEWRRVNNKHKVACGYCGKKLLPRSLKHHQHYFCGPASRRTAKLRLRDKKRLQTRETP